MFDAPAGLQQHSHCLSDTDPIGASQQPGDRAAFGQRIALTLELLRTSVPVHRSLLHAGDTIYQAGRSFECLYVLSTGSAKIVSLSADGREQVVGLKFKGDWMGFDGIADGCHGCDAIAMDTGEVWAIGYDALLAAGARERALLKLLHEAMSREIAHDRDSLMSVCTLPAEARVADFLLQWSESMAKRGLRTDAITLRMTRAEIGNYLGMALETVSRTLSRLARENIINFVERGRRHVRIADPQALQGFVQRCAAV
ncbi:MAG: Crp/Fnr family transcriptional regulator [Variovorax paradoxus]|jgi:CRP/FNR family transcriptional regulator|nr:MAG: Crp/Fnr family transcriptional regulator [Variovorax paradoxus]PZQ04459.1 MAG: Crp/Fnr family transcriptional regulator [Variovorax paradoxus]